MQTVRPGHLVHIYRTNALLLRKGDRSPVHRARPGDNPNQDATPYDVPATASP